MTETTTNPYLTPPAVITEEQYWDALECLPPENWTRTNGIEHFRFMEYYTNDITTQFAVRKTPNGNQHISKRIKVSDESTWITAADFAACYPEATCTQ